MCSLSAAETRRTSGGGVAGGPGRLLCAPARAAWGVSVSVQPSTMAATRSPKRGADRLARGRAALVLHRVVQQGGDRLSSSPPVLQHQAGDRQQVGDVGDRGALAHLGGVQVGGVDQGVAKAGGESMLKLLREY